MRPTTKTKRERARAKQQHTHTHTQSHLPSKQKVNYSQHPMGGSNPRPPSKRNNAVHHQGKKEWSYHSIINTKKEREIVSNHQHKERERERVRPPSNNTHAKPFITTTKWGAEPSRVAQTPQPKAYKESSCTKGKKEWSYHSIIKTKHKERELMSHQQHKREREDAPHHQNKKREHAPSNKTHTKSFIFNTKSELLSQQPDGGLEPTAAEQKKQCCSPPREKS